MAEPVPRPGTSLAASDGDRRGFFTRVAAICIGLVVGLFPVLSGLAVLFDPLRRKAGKSGMVRVASLAAVPDDGVPRQFRVVLAQKDDAWTRHTNVPVGAVYLVRQPGSTKVLALHSTCPHAGCFVSYLRGEGLFGCPCHRSSFGLDGKRVDPASSPSPRDMDSLECEVRTAARGDGPAGDGDGQEVWVRFQNFQIATPEKIAKA
jgi:menaquinol-cytochrome c reductase iron-sulfur subunit